MVLLHSGLYGASSICAETLKLSVDLRETNIFRGVFGFCFSGGFFLFQRMPPYTVNTLAKIASQKIHKYTILNQSNFYWIFLLLPFTGINLCKWS